MAVQPVTWVSSAILTSDLGRGQVNDSNIVFGFLVNYNFPKIDRRATIPVHSVRSFCEGLHAIMATSIPVADTSDIYTAVQVALERNDVHRISPLGIAAFIKQALDNVFHFSVKPWLSCPLDLKPYYMSYRFIYTSAT